MYMKAACKAFQQIWQGMPKTKNILRETGDKHAKKAITSKDVNRKPNQGVSPSHKLKKNFNQKLFSPKMANENCFASIEFTLIG